MLPENLQAWEIILRLFVATIVGCLLGLNREMRGKPAGLKTHALVSLSSALLALLVLQNHAASGDPLSRVIQGVITGIGFLGAGVILRHSSGKITGLTTAATIWMAAALGLASGIGFWLHVVAATALLFLVLLLERWQTRVSPDAESDNADREDNGTGSNVA